MNNDFLEQVKTVANNKLTFTLEEKEKLEEQVFETIAEKICDEIKNEIVEKVKVSSSKLISGIISVKEFKIDDEVTIRLLPYNVRHTYTGTDYAGIYINVWYNCPVIISEKLVECGVTCEQKWDRKNDEYRWCVCYRIPFEECVKKTRDNRFHFFTKNKTEYRFAIDQTIQKISDKVVKIASREEIKVKWGAIYQKYKSGDDDNPKYFESQFVEDGFVYTNHRDHFSYYDISYEFTY